MSPLKSASSQKKKDWNEAVRQYNLPVNGVEVVIPGDFKPRTSHDTQTSSTRHEQKQRSKPAAPTRMAEPLKEAASKPAALRHHATTPPNKPTHHNNVAQLPHVAELHKPQKPTAQGGNTKHPIQYLVTRSLWIVAALAMLGNIPVYSMIRSTDHDKVLSLDTNNTTLSPAYLLKELHLPAVPVESYSGYALDILPDAHQGNWTMRTVMEGDTLDNLLNTVDLTRTAKEMFDNSDIKAELTDLSPNARVLIQVVEGRLLQLIYAKSKTETFIVSATDQGFVGKWDEHNEMFFTRNSQVAFTIKHSLQRDGKTAGLSKSVIRQLSQVFIKDTDFKKVRVGDTVGVIYEDFQYQGQSIYTDKILAAEYSTKGTTYQRVRFTLADGKTDYFHPDGNDAELRRIAFDRKPIEGGRMSSGFGMRNHPIFGILKAHQGVDFAAPHGTPIFATADGSVKFAGQQGGYGNVIELRHQNGITTLYGHMSAFAEGMQAGKTIKRGEVIGYVGSTGSSTGNHVHYEYHINGEPQDPATVELPEVGIMSEQEADEFKQYASTMLEQLTDLRKLATLPKPAQKPIGG